MTSQQLCRAGTLLFGPNWKHAFGDRFAIADRTVARMAVGARPIPDSLALEIETALRDHASLCDELREVISP